MEADVLVSDVRWMAYMLATAYWETAVTVTRRVPKLAKRKPVLDKAGLPVMRNIRVWQNLAPSEEIGHGSKKNHGPDAKVTPLPDGGAQVVEQGWDNYASAGVMLGRGLDFLFQPELTLKPDIAYKIMSTGTRTGLSFANRMKLETYLHGTRTDYAGARAIINGEDCKLEIAEFAEIARQFEIILLESKIKR